MKIFKYSVKMESSYSAASTKGTRDKESACFQGMEGNC